MSEYSNFQRKSDQKNQCFGQPDTLNPATCKLARGGDPCTLEFTALTLRVLEKALNPDSPQSPSFLRRTLTHNVKLLLASFYRIVQLICCEFIFSLRICSHSMWFCFLARAGERAGRDCCFPAGVSSIQYGHWQPHDTACPLSCSYR